MPACCWFDRRAHRKLTGEARHWKLRETGGALLGWREDDQTVVAHVLGPGPNAVHRQHSFEPDGPWQQRQGAHIYRDSGRMVTFLGDWHTHPFGAPMPSSQDSKTATMLADDPRFRTPVPLYAILGRTTWPRARRQRRCKLVVYELRERKLEPIEVHLTDVEIPGGVPRD